MKGRNTQGIARLERNNDPSKGSQYQIEPFPPLHRLETTHSLEILHERAGQFESIKFGSPHRRC